jgi:hypothetical protein
MIVTLLGDRNAEKNKDSVHQSGTGCMCGPTERLRKETEMYVYIER